MPEDTTQALASAPIPPEWSQQHSGRNGTLRQPEPNSYLFSVRSGDVWVREAVTNPTERSELSHRTRWPFSEDFWFAFDMTILSRLPIDAKWAVVGQLHSSPNPGDGQGSPPWAQVIFPDGRFTIQIRYSSQMPLRQNPPPVTLFTDTSLERGRRYAFVYRLRYDPKGGALDAWRDGQKIVTYRGPLGYPGTVGPYLKFGIYRAKALKEMNAAFAHIRVGTSACAVVQTPLRLQDLPDATKSCWR